MVAGQKKARVALITGASGGIGWSTAEKMAQEGYRLVLHGHRSLEALKVRVNRSLPGTDTLVLGADVRNPEEVTGIFEAAESRFSSVDTCVCSAGVWPKEDLPLDQTDPARIRNVLDINLLGSILTARGFLHSIRKTGTRNTSLVLVGSTAGQFGEAGHTEYAASKAGLRGLMLSYKNEIVSVDPDGRCNLVEPGWTATPMAEPALESDKAVRRAISTMALRRIARPEEVAAAICFFSSRDQAIHLTGQSLTVAGGMEGRVLWDGSQIDTAAIRDELR